MVGVPKDDGLAVEWYRKATSLGDMEAQFNLGHMYRLGRGVAQSLRKR